MACESSSLLLSGVMMGSIGGGIGNVDAIGRMNYGGGVPKPRVSVLLNPCLFLVIDLRLLMIDIRAVDLFRNYLRYSIPFVDMVWVIAMIDQTYLYILVIVRIY